MQNESMSSFIAWAKLFGYFLSVAIFDYLDIPQDQFYILWSLMVIDTITGVAKAWRLNAVQITSHTMWLGVVKKLLTLLLILSLALATKWVGLQMVHLLSGTLWILIIAELYSIIQNIYTFRTGVLLPEYDAISIVLKKLGDFMKRKIDDFLVKKSDQE